MSTLSGQLDDTVTTLRTVDGGSRGILQYVDGGNILRVDVQEFGELLVTAGRDIEVRHIDIPHVAIDNDEGVLVGQRRE